jgi:hypothetical protein
MKISVFDEKLFKVVSISLKLAKEKQEEYGEPERGLHRRVRA